MRRSSMRVPRPALCSAKLRNQSAGSGADGGAYVPVPVPLARRPARSRERAASRFVLRVDLDLRPVWIPDPAVANSGWWCVDGLGKRLRGGRSRAARRRRAAPERASRSRSRTWLTSPWPEHRQVSPSGPLRDTSARVLVLRASGEVDPPLPPSEGLVERCTRSPRRHTVTTAAVGVLGVICLATQPKLI
jgi:hypothetical protein